jgi:hypothetical protein
LRSIVLGDALNLAATTATVASFDAIMISCRFSSKPKRPERHLFAISTDLDQTVDSL